MNHVALHQTVIGLEAEKQMAMAGEYPDVVIGCFGGGSNFSGISFPFMRHNFADGRSTRFIAAEPASCPKLTRGRFCYDYGDEAGYTPLIPMLTLRTQFCSLQYTCRRSALSRCRAVVSQLRTEGVVEAVDIPQLETFEAATLFARTRRYNSGSRELACHCRRDQGSSDSQRGGSLQGDIVQPLRPRTDRHGRLRPVYSR